MNLGLTEILNQSGKPTRLFQSPDGTTALILPYGGRVIGLYGSATKENFYWTNPALGSLADAAKLYSSNGWHNSGGDRTFLSPEVDLFYPRFPDLQTYVWPVGIDPGEYSVESSEGTVRLANHLSLTMSRSKETVHLRLTKTIQPAPNPLRYEPAIRREGIEYAGYTLVTSLAILNTTPARIGLWNLVQLPHGGDFLSPTFFRTDPRIFFGRVRAEDLLTSDSLVRYTMRDVGNQKIAVRAAASTGRMGYVYSTGTRVAAVIRNFSVNPSGEYADVPRDDTADFGYAVQACNVNCEIGRFSEMEYHVPAIGGDTGRTSCEDVSQVWAFRGSRDGIRAVVGNLLSPLP